MIGLAIGLSAHRRVLAAAWTPANLPPGVLVAWHHCRDASQVGGIASGSLVSSWSDLGSVHDTLTASGAARGTYYAAQYGGRPRVRLRPTQSMVGAVARSGITHMLVATRVAWPDFPRGAGDSNLFLGGSNFPGILGLSANDGTFNQILLTASGDGATWFNGASQTSYRRNGIEIGTSVMDPGFDRTRYLHEMTFATPRSGAPLAVGRDRNRTGVNDASPSDMGEIILYNANAPGANPSVDLPLIREYLRWWLGGPMVAISGDSISAGYLLNYPQAWPAVLDESLGGSIDFPNRALANMGIGASHSGVTVTMRADDATRLDPQLVGRTGRKIAFGAGGINDLIAGRTPSQIVNDLGAWAADRRAAGFDKVGASTVIDCGYSSGSLRPSIATLNAMLRGVSYLDFLSDPAADPRFGAGAANSTADYLSDTIHPNVTGAAYLGLSIHGPAILAALA